MLLGFYILFAIYVIDRIEKYKRITDIVTNIALVISVLDIYFGIIKRNAEFSYYAQILVFISICIVSLLFIKEKYIDKDRQINKSDKK